MSSASIKHNNYRNLLEFNPESRCEGAWAKYNRCSEVITELEKHKKDCEHYIDRNQGSSDCGELHARMSDLKLRNNLTTKIEELKAFQKNLPYAAQAAGSIQDSCAIS